MECLLLRFGTLTKGPGHLLQAARHNKRTIQAELGADSHIIATRSHLNYALAGYGTPDEIAAAAKRKMAEAGIDADRLRKNAVRAIEVLFSLRNGTSIDHRAYFTACTQWATERFGVSNLLASDVHLDESAPHCHILVLPIRNGRMAGSEMLGKRPQIIAACQDFHDKVASHYGLTLQPKLKGRQKASVAEVVRKQLLSESDAVVRSRVWQAVCDAIANDPEPFASILGIDLAKPKASHASKSFTDIMTGSGKRTSEDRKPIGNVSAKTPFPILCRKSPIHSPSAPEQFIEMVRVRDEEISAGDYDADTGGIELVRVRDEEMPAESFDSDTGEFREPRGNSSGIFTRLAMDSSAQWETA